MSKPSFVLPPPVTTSPEKTFGTRIANPKPDQTNQGHLLQPGNSNTGLPPTALVELPEESRDFFQECLSEGLPITFHLVLVVAPENTNFWPQNKSPILVNAITPTGKGVYLWNNDAKTISINPNTDSSWSPKGVTSEMVKDHFKVEGNPGNIRETIDFFTRFDGQNLNLVSVNVTKEVLPQWVDFLTTVFEQGACLELKTQLEQEAFSFSGVKETKN